MICEVCSCGCVCCGGAKSIDSSSELKNSSSSNCDKAVGSSSFSMAFHEGSRLGTRQSLV